MTRNFCASPSEEGERDGRKEICSSLLSPSLALPSPSSLLLPMLTYSRTQQSPTEPAAYFVLPRRELVHAVPAAAVRPSVRRAAPVFHDSGKRFLPDSKMPRLPSVGVTEQLFKMAISPIPSICCTCELNPSAATRRPSEDATHTHGGSSDPYSCLCLRKHLLLRIHSSSSSIPYFNSPRVYVPFGLALGPTNMT